MKNNPVTFAHPENQKNDIGHFMVAACALIVHPTEKKILLIKRADNHRYDEWEHVGGRIAQHEEITEGMKREVFEETGLNDISILRPLRFWHLYRGKRNAETEIFGMTFLCKALSENVILTPREHSDYKWVTPEEALKLVSDEGIKMDIQLYIDTKSLVLTSAKDTVLL